MYNAFHYGAPPHGGWAIGLDRLLMLLLDESNIRDVYAFPLSSNGVDVLMGAPGEVDQKQLDDVGLEYNQSTKLALGKNLSQTLIGEKLHLSLIKFLDSNGIKYKQIEHAAAKTSEESAKIRGTKLEQGAKALLEFADDIPVLIVLSASRKLDNNRFKAQFGIKNLRMATKEEVVKITSTEIGAVPPFGNLFSTKVYVDRGLLDNREIAFNAGMRTRSIIMSSSDFVNLVKPQEGDYAAEN